MSRIVLTAASRVGCIRSNNEDMVLAYDKFVRSDAYRTEFMTENNERFVIALADGMGGHRAGEVASEQTLDSLKFFINDIPRGLSIGEFDETMLEWLEYINTTINRRGNSDPRCMKWVRPWLVLSIMVASTFGSIVATVVYIACVMASWCSYLPTIRSAMPMVRKSIPILLRTVLVRAARIPISIYMSLLPISYQATPICCVLTD